MKIFLFLLCLLPSICFSASDKVSVLLDQVKLSDLARVVYGDMLRRSYVFDADVIHASLDISVHWQDFSSEKIEQLTNEVFISRGYDLKTVDGVLILAKKKKETVLDDVFVYSPQFRSARYLGDVLAHVAQTKPMTSRGIPASPEIQASIAAMPENSSAASAQFDKSANDQLAYSCSVEECLRLDRILKQLDTPEANVILRAVIYEVNTTKGEGSALQVAAKLFKGRYMFNAGSVVSGASSFAVASGGLDAVVTLLDSDTRFNSLSRPSLRVKTGANARFSVGEQVPVLGSIFQDRNGNPVQSVEYRQSGTIFTVQPDIHGQVVDLNVTQELSSFSATSTGVNNSPTLMQRTANSTLSLKDGEVVVFAGLEQNKNDVATASLFGFSLSKKTSNSRSEILLFIEAQRI